MRPEHCRVDADASHCASDDAAAASQEQLAQLPGHRRWELASTGERGETPCPTVPSITYDNVLSHA
jgi:hypothetical protein